MFSVLRSRMTYANVAATLAMVFAMTGGAYAASKYLITSTKQIKPSVLASLKGKNGANGAPGAQGPAGPAGLAGGVGKEGAAGKEGKEGPAGKDGAAGPAGPAGATGKNGAPGAPGSPGAAGATGPAGPAGATGPKGATGATGATGLSGFTSTLPSGKTETGTWSVSAYGLPGKNKPVPVVPISFPIPLKEGSKEPGEHAFYYTEHETEAIEEGELVPASGCTGSLHEPTAPVGKLCIYTETEETPAQSVQFAFIIPPRGPGVFPKQFGSSGAFITFETKSEPADINAKGTWAVTAP